MRPYKPEYRDAFTSLPWAVPLLDSSEWTKVVRYRGDKHDTFDAFADRTILAHDGLRLCLELYKDPPTLEDNVAETVSLWSFGPGWTGYPSIIHGGATMLMFDESLAYAMVANEVRRGNWDALAATWKTLNSANLQHLLKGSYVTANLNVKFLRPVLCPGAVGVEVKVLEDNGKRMKMRGVMKDGEEKVLATAEGTWVKLGAKL